MMQPFEWALLAALVLAGLEVVTGTFVLLGFCLGCLAVAATDVVSGVSALGRDAVVFVVVATIATVALRRSFGRAGDSARVERDVNDY